MQTCKILGVFIFLALVFFSVSPVFAADETTTETLIDNEYQGEGTAKGWQGDDTQWTYSLPFSFPFYGTSYSSIKVGSNGYVCLDVNDSCAGYSRSLSDSNGPFIAPLLMDLVTDEGGDIYVTEESSYVIIRWQAKEYSGLDELNFELLLHESGSFKINYGTFEGTLSSGALVGMSKGDGVDYTASAYNGNTDFNQVQTLQWGGFPPEVQSFTPQDNEVNVPLDQTLSITFDKAVSSGTGSIDIHKASDDSLVEAIDSGSSQITGWGTATLSIETSGLAYDTEYYVLIDNGAIEDASSVAYGGISDSTSWSFTTKPNDTTLTFTELIDNNTFIDTGNSDAKIDYTAGTAELYPPGWVKMGGESGYNNVSDAPQNDQTPFIILDNSGNPMIAWDSSTSGYEDEVYFSRWNGSQWTQMDGTAGYDTLSNTVNAGCTSPISLDTNLVY